MRDFRTTVSIVTSSAKISLKTPILTAGSCFSDAIGMRLLKSKVPATVNPFGTVYNPLSIHKQFEYALLQSYPPDSSFVASQGIYLNYDFHSRFSSLSPSETSDQIRRAIDATHGQLIRSKWLMLTYGTAWVYRHNKLDDVVANCHKIPSKEFTKSLLEPNVIVDSFSRWYAMIKEAVPDVRVILTVSPVRHIKDTLDLNSVSKSVLRLACHELSKKYDDVDYFPAYEIMIDDLRDYRFYASDMIHPTADAENYIWEKFCHRYMDTETREFVNHFEEIVRAIQHKPFHPMSGGHQQFLKDTLRRLENLSSRVDVSEEIAAVKRLIIH